MYVSDLEDQLSDGPPWINTTEYSTPVYTVGPDEPTSRVTLDGSDDQLQAAWEQVPIPPNAQPAIGTDQQMVIYQPSTDTMWEFWIAQKRADGWHARWGGRLQNVSMNPGYYSIPGWGATASSLPLLGGLVRLSELKAGHIDHALAMAVPDTLAGVYSWPAQSTDGTSNSADAIPEGTRFRIDPALDLARIPMSPIVRMLAVAAQRYGIVVRDTAPSVTFYAEDPTPTGTNPFAGPSGYYEDQMPSVLLEQFPWSHLETLPMALHTQS